MSQQSPALPICPKCESTRVTLRQESVEYGPEQWLGQPLKSRELFTKAYQCECGMAFTQTVRSEEQSPGNN